MRKVLIFGAAALLFSCGGKRVGENSWMYGSKSAVIAWTGYEVRGNGDIRFVFSPEAPVDNNAGTLARRVEIILPKGGLDIKFDLAVSRMAADQRQTGWNVFYIDHPAGLYWQGGEEMVDEDDIVSGSMRVVKTGPVYDITLTAKFRDGKTMQLRYSGQPVDMTTVLILSEGEGEMRISDYQPSAIAWGGFTRGNGVTTIALCAAVPVRNLRLATMNEGVIVLDIPDYWLGREIPVDMTGEDLSERKPWRFVCNGVSPGAIYYGSEAGSNYRNDTRIGWITVERKNGNNFAVTIDIGFMDGFNTLKCSYEGSLVDIVGLGVPVTMW